MKHFTYLTSFISVQVDNPPSEGSDGRPDGQTQTDTGIHRLQGGVGYPSTHCHSTGVLFTSPLLVGASRKSIRI